MAKQTVFSSKKRAEKRQLKDVENDTQTVFRTAKEMKKENKDIVCERRILGNSGKLVYSLEEKKKLGSSIIKDCLMLNFLGGTKTCQKRIQF